jgi:hypothetical protein
MVILPGMLTPPQIAVLYKHEQQHWQSTHNIGMVFDHEATGVS